MFAPRPVDKYRGDCSATDKTHQESDARKDDGNFTDDKVIGYARNNASHVRGIALPGEKATRIHCAGDKCQDPTEGPVILLGPSPIRQCDR